MLKHGAAIAEEAPKALTDCKKETLSLVEFVTRRRRRLPSSSLAELVHPGEREKNSSSILEREREEFVTREKNFDNMCGSSRNLSESEMQLRRGVCLQFHQIALMNLMKTKKRRPNLFLRRLWILGYGSNDQEVVYQSLDYPSMQRNVLSSHQWCQRVPYRPKIP